MDFLKFSEPYVNEIYDEIQVMITINLYQIIDPYDYHDFPHTVQEFVGLESIDELVHKLTEIKEKIEALKGEQNG